MRVLVTGCHGYIGSVLTTMLIEQQFDVVGADTGWFQECTFGEAFETFPVLPLDVRDVKKRDLVGFDAVMHLAALSNDPLGNVDPSVTLQINHQATVRLARLAKEAGVGRFIFSSSCSTYGAAGAELITEEDELNPVTSYGESKVLVDRDLADMASDDFSPVLLRNATAYGVSPRIRLDLVLNDLVATAFTTGRVLLKSDGTPWRPIVHVEDISRAFIAAATAPRRAVHNQIFNIGSTSENYRVSELAEIVRATVPGSELEYAADAGPDKRCYRVDFGKATRLLPGFYPRWTAHTGAQQLYSAYQSQGLSESEAEGPKYRRLPRLQQLLAAGRLDHTFRWKQETAAACLS